MTTNNKQQKIEQIKKVLTEFNRNNVKYCVLRNYEFLLGDQMPVESMDTSIAALDMPKAVQILKRIGFTARTQQFSLKHKAYFKVLNKMKVSFDIQVGGIYWNDMRYLNEDIFKRRIKNGNFYVLSSDDLFVMFVAHSILGKRYFKPKYQKILSQIKKNNNNVESELSRIFGKRAKEILRKVHSNQFKKIKTKQLALSFILKNPKYIIIFTKLFFRWIKWKNPFSPAPLISIMGPDGAGKSSAAKALNNFLNQNKRKSAVVYTGRGRNQLLPIRKIGNAYKSAEKKRDKRKKKSNNMGRATLYTIAAPIFTLDLLLRYTFKIFPKRMRKSIIITDRYGYDIILMKHVPFAIRKIFFDLFPKPTITIYLYNTPEILHKRRPEDSIKELKRQMDIFKQLNYSLKIRTTNQKDDTEKLIDFVLAKLIRIWY